MEIGPCGQDLGPYTGRGAGWGGRVLWPVGRRGHDEGHGEIHGGQAHHLRHGQSGPRDQARRGRGRAGRCHYRDRPLGLSEPGQQCARLSLHLPRCARCSGDHHQRSHEDRGRRGARPARPDRGARRGCGGLWRHQAALWQGLHHPRPLRSPPDLGDPDSRRQGGHGFRGGAAHHRGHGGLLGASQRPAQSGGRLAAGHLRAGAPQPQARRLRRGRGGAGGARRQHVPEPRPRLAHPHRPRRAHQVGLQGGGRRAPQGVHPDQCPRLRAVDRVRRIPLPAPAAQRVSVPRLPAHGEHGSQHLRRLHGGAGACGCHGDGRHAQLVDGLCGCAARPGRPAGADPGGRVAGAVAGSRRARRRHQRA